jgi:hypothetical protein
MSRLALYPRHTPIMKAFVIHAPSFAHQNVRRDFCAIASKLA